MTCQQTGYWSLIQTWMTVFPTSSHSHQLFRPFQHLAWVSQGRSLLETPVTRDLKRNEMSRFRVLPRWVYLCITFTHLCWWQHFLCLLSFCLLLYQSSDTFRSGSGCDEDDSTYSSINTLPVQFTVLHTHRSTAVNGRSAFAMHPLASAKNELLTHKNQKSQRQKWLFKFFFDLVSCSDRCWVTEQATRLQNFCLPLTLPSIPW